MTVDHAPAGARDAAVGDLPTVSVVIPAHERPDFLTEAIKSALAQTVPPIEVIVVDDGSTVDLRPGVAVFGAPVRYERVEPSRGAPHARNRGVALAKGDAVAFLDDDDIWMPDKLARQLGALTEGVDAVICGYCFLHDASKQNVHAVDRVEARLLRKGNHYCGSSGLLARRAILLETQWDESLPNGQDWDIYIRLAQRAPLAYVPAPLFRFRRDGQQSIVLVSAQESPKELMKGARVAEKHRYWLGERNYRRKVAGYLLRFIGLRESKLPFILFSIKHAGLWATLYILYQKLRRIEHMASL